MEETSMCHLPAKLVGEKILTRVPITSLRSVRSTCKLWDALTKDWILGRAEQFFLGFMTKDSKVCSVRFHLCRSKDKDKEDEDLLDLSIKKVDLLNQVKIARVLHCDGLLLCVAMYNSRLLMWNPYLGQTQWIGLTTNFCLGDCYALGYDSNHNHKILRFLNSEVRAEHKRYQIYEFSSNSWKDLKVNLTPDQEIEPHPSSVSLKGNTYFFAQQSIVLETDEDGGTDEGYEYFLLCFDFTTERFGSRLPLPSNSVHDDNVTLSCVREEKLALLYNAPIGGRKNIVQIWVTTTIGPHHVSWSQFLRVELEPFAFTDTMISRREVLAGSFFIDEEEKVAVVFDFNRDYAVGAVHNHTAFVVGEGGFFKSVSLGAAHNLMKCLSSSTDVNNPETHYCTPHVCSSSYFPSLVQLNQPHKEEEE